MQTKRTCIVQFDYKAAEADEITLTKGDRVINVVDCADQDGWCTGTNTSTGKHGLFPDNFVKFETVVEKTTSSIAKSIDAKLGQSLRAREQSGDNNEPASPSAMSSKPVPPPSSKKPPALPSKQSPTPLSSSNQNTENISNNAVTSTAAPNSKKFKVTFAYAADNADELTLQVGDVIEFLEEVEEGWAKGKCNGKVGLYPTNFCTEIKNNQKAIIPAGSSTIPDTTSTNPAIDDNRKRLRADFPYKANNKDELSFKKGDIITLVTEDGGDPGWWKGELNGKSGVFPDNFVTPLPQKSLKTQSVQLRNTSHTGIGGLKIGAAAAATKSATSTPTSDTPNKPRPMSELITSDHVPLTTGAGARRAKPAGKRPPTRKPAATTTKTEDTPASPSSKPATDGHFDDLFDATQKEHHNSESNTQNNSDSEIQELGAKGPTPSIRKDKTPKQYGVKMPGMPGGADFMQVLKKRHEEVTGKKEEESSSVVPSKPKPKPVADSKPEWIKKINRTSAIYEPEQRKQDTPPAAESPEEMQPIARKKTVKDMLRGFESNKPEPKTDVVQPKPLVKPTSISPTSNLNRAPFNTKPTRPNTHAGGTGTAQPVSPTSHMPVASLKRSVSPQSNIQQQTHHSNLNNSSSTTPATTSANTSTDSAHSEITNNKKVHQQSNNTSSLPSHANAALLQSSTLTLPQLSKLIQDQAKMIEVLQEENRDLSARVAQLEKLQKTKK